MKTASFASPFCQNTNKKRVVFVLVIVTIAWAGATLVDVLIYAQKQSYLLSSFGCLDLWAILFDYDFTGKGVSLLLFDTKVFGHDTSLIAMKLIISSVYLLPSFFVLCCMIVQMINIKNTLLFNSETHGTSKEASVFHVNLTVFIVSIFFVICTSAYGIFFLVEFALAQTMTHWIEFVVKYTLPLANASFFPIIIIWRKKALRQRYTEFWKAICVFPVRLIQQISRRMSVRSGYQPIAKNGP